MNIQYYAQAMGFEEMAGRYTIFFPECMAANGVFSTGGHVW